MPSLTLHPKSRWKGAAFSTAVLGALVPLAAQASLTVNLSLSPLGATGFGTPAAPQSSNYLTPDNTNVPIYVYATVTGQNALTATDLNGLTYLYYNISNGVVGAGIPGTLTATLNPNFAGLGSQSGLTGSATIGNTGGVVVGSSGTDPIGYAKPEGASSGTQWSNMTSDGTNVIVNAANSTVSFLVETLNFHPSAFNPSTPGNLNSATFSVSIPNVANLPSNSPANWYEDSPSTIINSNPNNGPVTTAAARNGTPGYGTYSAGSTATVTLTDTLMGDANADGTVNFTDLGAVLQNYSLSGKNWSQGEFSGGGTVNFSDLGSILQNYTLSVGAAPSVIAGSAALLADPAAVSLLEAHGFTVTPAAVPEPASLGILGMIGAGMLARRRRK